MEYCNLPASDLSFATPNTKQSSSIDLVNTPRNPINTRPETPNFPQQGQGICQKIIESETFTGSISEKMKIENLKTEIISSLEFNYLFFVSERVKHIER